ncbi:hypothetical protein Taro_009482 [Colocasia esculenta]|uniref:Uncharacterized protein n=1 Tax=Colocasia esculenta TaxID=4460 RepID=A0A843U5U7_COLES|nr:hypothetical protein [Colocasia esculenta]
MKRTIPSVTFSACSASSRANMNTRAWARGLPSLPVAGATAAAAAGAASSTRYLHVSFHSKDTPCRWACRRGIAVLLPTDCSLLRGTTVTDLLWLQGSVVSGWWLCRHLSRRLEMPRHHHWLSLDPRTCTVV